MSIVRSSVKAVIPGRVRRRLRAAQRSATDRWRGPQVPLEVLRFPSGAQADETQVVLAQLQYLAAAHAAALTRVEEVLRSIVDSLAATPSALAESAERNAADHAGLAERLRSISMAQEDDVAAGRSVHRQLRLISERLAAVERIPLRTDGLSVASYEENVAVSRDR